MARWEATEPFPEVVTRRMCLRRLAESDATVL
jgi:hypothetical protein